MQQYLLREVQNVYRSQRVEIDDKHIEIIVAQMLRKVKVEDVGDTEPPARLGHRQVRASARSTTQLDELREDQGPGRHRLQRGRRSSPSDDVRARPTRPLEAAGKEPAKGKQPKPAAASTQLLGITKAAVQSESFISAASFQETTKVLTEAALAGKVDTWSASRRT